MPARTFAVFALLLPLLPLDAQEAGTGAVSGTPSVAVTGEGEARAVPDRALITVGVESRAQTAAAAAADNARRQRAILDTLRALGFTHEQLTTTNYSVRPEMQYGPEGQRPRVIAYVVSNMVRVDLRDVQRAAQVIDAALARGANQIHGLSFYLSDPGPARRAAITDAMARARADAEALARAAGGSLGRILELTTAPMPIRPFYREVAMSMTRGDAAAPTPVEPGEEVVRATVSARWAFVPR